MWLHLWNSFLSSSCELNSLLGVDLESLNSQKPELSVCIFFLWLSSSYFKVCDLFSLIIVSVIQTLTAGWPLRGSLCGVCRDLAFLKALPSLWIWVTSHRPQAKTQKMQALLSSPVMPLLLRLLSPLHGLTPQGSYPTSECGDLGPALNSLCMQTSGFVSHR